MASVRLEGGGKAGCFTLGFDIRWLDWFSCLWIHSLEQPRGCVCLWWWYYLLCFVRWNHCHLARLVPFLLKNSTKSNSKWGFFCSGTRSHLLQGIAVIVDWHSLQMVSHCVRRVSDALEVLNTISLVRWGLWHMSSVVLHILENQALIELLFVGCS